MSCCKKRKRYVYFSGPIEAASDFGVDWREKLTPEAKRFGFTVLDPIVTTCKMFSVSNMNEAHAKLNKLERENSQEYRRLVQQIKKQDLAMVKKCSNGGYVVTFWDPYTPTVGTSDENRVAAENGIPILLVCYHSIDKIHSWLQEWVWQSNGLFFSNFKELVKFWEHEELIMRYHSSFCKCSAK